MPHRQHIQHLVSFVLDKSLSSQLSSNHVFNYFFFSRTENHLFIILFWTSDICLLLRVCLHCFLIDVLSKVNAVQWAMQNIQRWIAGVVHNLIRSWKPVIVLSDNPANVYVLLSTKLMVLIGAECICLAGRLSENSILYGQNWQTQSCAILKFMN